MSFEIGDKVIYTCGITGKQKGTIRDKGLVDNGKRKTFQVLLETGNIIELMNDELIEKDDD